MKALLIAAPASGSGKTTITLGLIRALQRQGIDVCAYKAGPDYIDRAFLEHVSGRPAGNLDLHLQGQEGMFYSLSRAPTDAVLVEGVMGLFDGIANTSENSCHHLAKLLQIPTLLVYSPQGEMFTAIPKIKGMAEFDHSSIKGVLFNNVSEKYYRLLDSALTEHTDLNCVGYAPKLTGAVFKSRHLGLVQAQEISDLDDQAAEIASLIEETVDLEAIVDMMRTPAIPDLSNAFSIPRTDIKVGIALDPAFSFYYRENLELLESCCQTTCFSPMRDPSIPDCDLLYFGGGYPEVFRRELSANKSMLKAVKEFGEEGGFIFGECGGLMYLAETIDDCPMAGLFKGGSKLTNSLQRFGYVDIQLETDCILGKQGARFPGHEFHKSISNIDAPAVFRVFKTKSDAQWSCGFQYKNVIAGYPHLNFLGNIDILKHLLNSINT